MREPQGVASLALGYVFHWAFSPPLLNPKLELCNGSRILNKADALHVEHRCVCEISQQLRHKGQTPRYR